MKRHISPPRGWRPFVLLLPLFALSLHGSARYGPVGKITVLVFTYTKVSDKALRRAEREARRLFEPAGIEINWMDCSREQSPDACGQRPGPETMILIVRRGSAAVRQAFHLTDHSCGFALRGNDEVKGSRLILFYNCVQETAGKVREPAGMILGHVVAHEMAHLFFLRDRHSPTGLMQARLGPEDWKQASAGELTFTDADLAEIRAGFEARLFAAGSREEYARKPDHTPQPD